MYSSNEIIKILNDNMSKIKKFHVMKIALFGSFAREEQNEKSDIDIIVEFDVDHETLDNYMDLKFYLEELFMKKIDLVILNSIKPTLKSSIMRSVIYAKGA